MQRNGEAEIFVQMSRWDFVLNTSQTEESEEGEKPNHPWARAGDEEQVSPRGKVKLVESEGYGGGSERVSTHVLCA